MCVDAIRGCEGKKKGCCDGDVIGCNESYVEDDVKCMKGMLLKGCEGDRFSTVQTSFSSLLFSIFMCNNIATFSIFGRRMCFIVHFYCFPFTYRRSASYFELIG